MFQTYNTKGNHRHTHAGHAETWSNIVCDASRLCWHLVVSNDLVLLDLISCGGFTCLHPGRWQSSAALSERLPEGARSQAPHQP